MMAEPSTVWVLFLNDMRSAHFEDQRPWAWARSRAKLEALLARERVPLYKETTGMPAHSPNTHPTPWAHQGNPTEWCKSFRKGGPLEWANVPTAGVDEPFVEVEDIAGSFGTLFDANLLDDACVLHPCGAARPCSGVREP